MPRPGETCSLVGAVLVQARDVARPQVREPETPAGVRHDDLPGVVVPREDQVEDLRDPPHDPGEVAEEDAEVGRRVRQLVR